MEMVATVRWMGGWNHLQSISKLRFVRSQLMLEVVVKLLDRRVVAPMEGSWTGVAV